MKKILFVICTIICVGFTSCTGCRGGQGQHDQDTIVIDDTVIVETFDTVFVDE